MRMIMRYRKEPTAVTRSSARQNSGSTQSFVSNQALLRRLQPRVGSINDPLEREAAAAAEKVVHMPAPVFGLTATPAHISRKCTTCAEEDDRMIRAKSAKTETGNATEPDIVQDVLDAPGQPLDAGTRAFMQPRFGRDLGEVRLHTGSDAAASARSVNALAYTCGNHIVFGAGQYCPGSAGGRRLLAHELTHVLQQTGSSPTVSAIARTPNSTTVTVEAPRGPNVCTLDQGRRIAAAGHRADGWLDTASNALDALVKQPGTPAAAAASNAMTRHFHMVDAATVKTVYDRVVAIRKDMNGRVNLQVECHRTADRLCGASGAYVTGNTMAFCPNYFDTDDVDWQAEAIIHETAHALVGGPHITDRAYRSDRAYTQLTTQEALTNAESFGLLVQQLGTARNVGSTAPQDSFTDCPEDWKPLIRTAIAQAQRWNRNAQTATQDRRPEWLADWQFLQTRYLGSTATAALDQAQHAYDNVEDSLTSDVGFECELGRGGRCAAGAQTYWYALGHFHICPVWRNLPSDEARTTSLLAGLVGYKGGVDEPSRRWNYANLARELNSRYWP